jgi:pyroglutamyl-peptidase
MSAAAAADRRPTTGRVLITAFGPFPGAPFNPTPELARGLARRLARGDPERDITVHVFHTSYAAVDRDLPNLLAAHRPDIVLMLGLAARTPMLRLELQARNARSVLLADAGGKRSVQRSLQPGAPSVLRGSAPFAAITASWRKAGLRGRLSHNAGRYLCNYLYWQLCAADRNDGPKVFAFLHVPALMPLRIRLSRSPKRRALRVDDLLRGAEIALRALMVAAARR